MSAASSEPNVQTQVAVLERSVSDCQHVEAECRASNRQEHNEFFDRLREIEKALALTAQRIAFWSAIGSLVGAGAVSVAVYWIQRSLIAR